MTEIKVIVVDDEPVARRGLRQYLEEQTSANIVAECSHGQEAIDTIRSAKPDLVFLDIKMPKVDGFEVIKQIGPEKMPAVIFVTAYDDFAVKAFEAQALDYLLKPIDPSRVRQAYQRAVDRIQKDHVADIDERLRSVVNLMANQSSGQHPLIDSRLVVKDAGRIFFWTPRTFSGLRQPATTCSFMLMMTNTCCAKRCIIWKSAFSLLITLGSADHNSSTFDS